ncbi:MAG: HIT family protein [Firmicutes bacterium]|nr:HIT family protein [Bacillota bacterium]
MDCVFCNKFKEKTPVFENELALAYYDEFPVNKGHMLFITKRHIETFFDTSIEEQNAIFELVRKAKIDLDNLYHPDGYNIGLNCNESAGQSVMHIHLHLIPRYKGDVKNPRGGVRGVIPKNKDY